MRIPRLRWRRTAARPETRSSCDGPSALATVLQRLRELRAAMGANRGGRVLDSDSLGGLFGLGSYNRFRAYSHGGQAEALHRFFHFRQYAGQLLLQRLLGLLVIGIGELAQPVLELQVA